ncbi:MAG TPA: hypothetical protein GXX18_12720 [Bacillales bacterium]|nr:hypothetical protein [Bacillales bacterium]
MKRKRKSFLKRTAACSFALFIVLINFFLPIAALAGNYNPGSFSPGTFSPGTFNPGTFGPGTFDPGTFSPGTFSPGQFTPGQFTPGQFTPGEFSPGGTSPGTTNPGNFTPKHPGDGPGGNLGNSIVDPFSPPSSTPSVTDGPDKGEQPTGQDGSGSDNNRSLPFQYEDNPNYQAFKFITDNMVFPAIEGLDKHTLIDIDWNRYGEDYTGSLFKGVLKGQLEAGFKNESLLSAPVNLGLDIWSGVDNAKHIGKFLGSWSDIQSAWTTARAGGSFSTAASGATGIFLSEATKPFSIGTGIAGKVAPWMAAISTGISGAETIMNFANGNVNDGIASLGETLMSGAVVLSATGVGAPVAAGVAIVGGALWLGAKIYKNADAIASAWKNRRKLWNDAKKSVSNAVNTVKSGFKKVVGWFS